MRWLILLALGCGVNREVIEQVEGDYPTLRCINSDMRGAVICTDLEKNAYICFADEKIMHYPIKSVCLSSATPGAPKPPNSGQFYIDSYINVTK